MNEHAQEQPFLSEMEREPQPVEAQKPVWRDVPVSITRSLWTMHGMAHRVLDVLGLVGLKAKALAERGPNDFAPESDFERGVRVGSRMGGYQEAPKEPKSNGTATVIVGCTVALISTFVVSAWALSNQFSDFRGRTEEWQRAMEKRMESSDRRLDRLENRTP